MVLLRQADDFIDTIFYALIPQLVRYAPSGGLVAARHDDNEVNVRAILAALYHGLRDTAICGGICR